jgi:hypothetical protein
LYLAIEVFSCRTFETGILGRPLRKFSQLSGNKQPHKAERDKAENDTIQDVSWNEECCSKIYGVAEAARDFSNDKSLSCGLEETTGSPELIACFTPEQKH